MTSSSPNDRDLDRNETTKEDSETRHIDNKFITDNRKSRKTFKQENFIDKGNANSINNVIIENSTQSNERIRSYAEVVKYSTSNMSETFNKNNLSEIYKPLIEDENKDSLKTEIAPPKVCINSATSSNRSDSIVVENNPTVFSSLDEEILSILEKLQRQSPSKALNSSGSDLISGYFCSDTVFNLTKKVLTDIEIKVFEKGLDYAPIQKQDK